VNDFIKASLPMLNCMIYGGKISLLLPGYQVAYQVAKKAEMFPTRNRSRRQTYIQFGIGIAFERDY
jgi:hypothetical protein